MIVRVFAPTFTQILGVIDSTFSLIRVNLASTLYEVLFFENKKTRVLKDMDDAVRGLLKMNIKNIFHFDCTRSFEGEMLPQFYVKL